MFKLTDFLRSVAFLQNHFATGCDNNISLWYLRTMPFITNGSVTDFTDAIFTIYMYTELTAAHACEPLG